MLEFIKFELNYRLKRPVTYIYFVMLLVMAFIATATDVVRAGGSGGKVMENAPVVIALIMLFILFLGVFIASAVMGVPVLRDFEHKTDSMIFTTPASKLSYLGGKFLGSFLILMLISTGIVLGMMIGQAVPWPWLDNADRLLPFSFGPYLNAFLIFVLPNLFVFSSIFFAGGALGKRMVVVYAQGIALFMGYLVVSNFLSDMDNQQLAGFLDPFGFGALDVVTQYWTVAEQNSTDIPFFDSILTNRLLWLGIGLVSLMITYFGFSYDQTGKASKKTKKSAAKFAVEEKNTEVHVPVVNQRFSLGSHIIQIRSLTWFYFKWIVKQGPFLFILLAGVIFLFVGAFIGATGSYDIEVYFNSGRAVQFIGSFNLFFIIISVFYTGELIWKERDVKMNLIYDALPFPNYVMLASKLIGMVLMCVFILTVLMFSGIAIQLIKGYPVIDWNVYFAGLYTDTLAVMVLYVLLGLFVQAMINHKFVGFGLMFLFYISFLVLSELGIEHSMFYFGKANLGNYSEMNQFGHYVAPFSWFNLYWYGLAAVLYSVAILFTVRGLESGFITRLRLSQMRLNMVAIVSIITFSSVFILTGSYIYYNSNILNTYKNSDDEHWQQADYERTLRKFEFLNQPKIVGTYVEVEVYPMERDFSAKGYYILKNKSSETITEVHIQDSPDNQTTTKVDFEGGAEVAETFDLFGYTIFALNKPLGAGDSVKLNFEVSFMTEGFEEGESNNEVVYNGTFFNNTGYFPGIGYNSGFELTDDDDRKDNELEVKERMLKRDDPRGVAQSLFGDDADKIRFEIVIGTDTSQIAIAPGYLLKKWAEGNRAHYHYKMDVPMVNFYSIVSADYEVVRDSWKPPVDSLPDVALEIYYHKGHDFNIERMLKGLKESLTYYTENFSPYQFRQLRIMEFPKYRTFAQSFANTVPFSEGIGFIQKIKEDNVDIPFYVTAHEVAHQWWGHQVTEAGVRGNAMLSETLSQYSSLMVMKHRFPPEIIKEFLKYELNGYLTGRTFEKKKEMPLELVESQAYIHYNKGSLVMYALQDYVGEDSVNAALKRFARDWAFKDAPYPTSADLIGYYKEVTPDSLQYIITDMFETITLFENKVTKAEYQKISEDQYQVNVTVDAIKYRADSLGNETSIPLADWIDIGVFGKDEKGKDKLLYLKKHKISAQESSFEIFVSEEPAKAGIDPINKLIDRNPKDNVKEVELVEEDGV